MGDYDYGRDDDGTFHDDRRARKSITRAADNWRQYNTMITQGYYSNRGTGARSSAGYSGHRRGDDGGQVERLPPARPTSNGCMGSGVTEDLCCNNITCTEGNSDAATGDPLAVESNPSVKRPGEPQITQMENLKQLGSSVHMAEVIDLTLKYATECENMPTETTPTANVITNDLKGRQRGAMVRGLNRELFPSSKQQDAQWIKGGLKFGNTPGKNKDGEEWGGNLCVGTLPVLTSEEIVRLYFPGYRQLENSLAKLQSITKAVGAETEKEEERIPLVTEDSQIGNASEEIADCAKEGMNKLGRPFKAHCGKWVHAKERKRKRKRRAQRKIKHKLADPFNEESEEYLLSQLHQFGRGH